MLSLSRPSLPRSPNHARGLTALALWGARALALLWAGAWIAFTLSVVWGQDPIQTLFGGAAGAVILVPVLTAWAFPRFGGLVLVGVGTLAWLWAESESSRVGIVVPAISLGGAFLVLGSSAAWQRWRTRRKAVRLVRRMERERPAGAPT